MKYTITCKGSELSRKQAEILLTKGFGISADADLQVFMGYRFGTNLLLDYVQHNGVVLGFQGNFAEMEYEVAMAFEDLTDIHNDGGKKFDAAVNWHKGTNGDEMFEKFKHLLQESEATE